MIYHEDSAKVVNRAIQCLGEGNKGLAQRLNKNPSLISRYASGEVRPKAETLLKCIEIIRPFDVGTLNPSEKEQSYESMKNAISRLSPVKDDVLIKTILSVLILAKKA